MEHWLDGLLKEASNDGRDGSDLFDDISENLEFQEELLDMRAVNPRATDPDFVLLFSAYLKKSNADTKTKLEAIAQLREIFEINANATIAEIEDARKQLYAMALDPEVLG